MKYKDLEPKPTASAFFVHPKAICESAQIGEGTRVWAFAHIMEGARVGQDCNIGAHVFVEGGAWIGDRVTVKNQVAVWEGIELEEDVFVGPGAIFTNDRFPRSPRMAGNSTVAGRYGSKGWLVRTRIKRGQV